MRGLASLAGVHTGSLNLLVVDDRSMSDYHVRFSGVAGTTDVLTFDLRDDPAAAVEGDLVLCLDEARRQAEKRGHPVRVELLLYALHGLLHLLGYDDHSPRQRSEMHKAEDRLLAHVGLGPVYHTPKRRASRV
ncbi:MAG: rRNA maturation RNase YbeY [Planctomycetota bacterium]|nr:rRNA maturation RNase YbeY [Planctomycetota bacterium]